MPLNKENLMPKNDSAIRILNARAKQLAKKTQLENNETTLVAYICFGLGKKELYGIPYALAKEVLVNMIITPVPFVPNFIAGTINRHGNLIAILDLKLFFGMAPAKDYQSTNTIILVTANDLTIGILVDFIENSGSYNPLLLERTLAGFIKSEYLLGLHNGTVAIINVANILGELKHKMVK